MYDRVYVYQADVCACTQMAAQKEGKCLPNSTDLWFSGAVPALLSYVLFWTLMFDICHIYG